MNIKYIAWCVYIKETMKFCVVYFNGDVQEINVIVSIYLIHLKSSSDHSHLSLSNSMGTK